MKIVSLLILACVLAQAAATCVLPKYEYVSTIMPKTYSVRNYKVDVQCEMLATSEKFVFKNSQPSSWIAAKPSIINEYIAFHVKNIYTNDTAVCKVLQSNDYAYTTFVSHNGYSTPSYFAVEESTSCTFWKEGKENIAWCPMGENPSYSIVKTYDITTLLHHDRAVKDSKTSSCPILNVVVMTLNLGVFILTPILDVLTLFIKIGAYILLPVVYVIGKTITVVWYLLQAVAWGLLLFTMILIYSIVRYFTKHPKIK